MFQRTYAAVADEANGEIALRYVSGIIQYHRIQASPGYRAAGAVTRVPVAVEVGDD